MPGNEPYRLDGALYKFPLPFFLNRILYRLDGT